MVFYIDKEFIDKFVYKKLKDSVITRSSSLYYENGGLYYCRIEDLPICIKLEGGFVFWEDYPKTIDKKIINTLKNDLKSKKIIYLKGNLVKEVMDKHMTKLSEVLIKIVGKKLWVK